ncbi:hypothetical protein SDC9_80823 [bioreactor metagenome]|uniref:Uncharacterized protein n=1 Tax=bioreactor metagenome TaxID=1076179 RepID=A0A644Z2J9_9ZZZZ
MRGQHTDLVRHQQTWHIFVVTQKLHLIIKPKLRTELARAALRAGLATTRQLHQRPQAALAQQGDGLEQRSVILLPRESRRHDDAGNALSPRMVNGRSKRSSANPVGDGQRLARRCALAQQHLLDALGAAHDGVGALGQPQHLPGARPGVALARVVLHVHQMRHMRKQARIASPEVFAEAMRHQNVGLKALADVHQLQHGRQMRPACHQFNGKAFGAQRVDARQFGLRLAPEHQQRPEPAGRQMPAHQIHSHLGGARESAGHEVQHTRPRCGAIRRRTGRRGHRHGSECKRHAWPHSLAQRGRLSRGNGGARRALQPDQHGPQQDDAEQIEHDAAVMRKKHLREPEADVQHGHADAAHAHRQHHAPELRLGGRIQPLHALAGRPEHADRQNVKPQQKRHADQAGLHEDIQHLVVHELVFDDAGLEQAFGHALLLFLHVARHAPAKQRLFLAGLPGKAPVLQTLAHRRAGVARGLVDLDLRGHLVPAHGQHLAVDHRHQPRSNHQRHHHAPEQAHAVSVQQHQTERHGHQQRQPAAARCR